MAVLTSLKATTYENLQLDAGVIYTDLQESEMTSLNLSTLSGKKSIGATKGGATFSATPEIRSIFDGIDGARGVYKNGQTIDTWEAILKVTVSEMTADNLKKALCTTDDSNVKGVYKGYTPKVGMIAEENYLPQIAWVGQLAKGEQPIVIFLKNVLNTNGLNFTAEDKGTGGVELELKAHFDLSNPEEVPFTIYTPKHS